MKTITLRTLSAISLIAAISLFSAFPNAQAIDAPTQTPVQIFESMRPDMSSRGIIFNENFGAMDSLGYITYAKIPMIGSTNQVDPSGIWKRKLCTNWDDSTCKPQEGYEFTGRVYLGSCQSSGEIGCIEGLATRGDLATSQVKLELVGPALDGGIEIPESRKMNIPRSSSPTLYRDANSNLYLVRAVIFYSISSDGTAASKMDIDVYKVQKIFDPSVLKPEPFLFTDPVTGATVASVRNIRIDCLAVSVGACYKQAETDVDQNLALTLRLPTSVGGWFKGRLNSPTINISKLNSASNILSIEAKPVSMPIMGGWVNYDDLPADFISKLYPFGNYPTGRNQPLSLYSDASQGEFGFKEFSAWAPYLKDKALTTVGMWSFGTNLSYTNNSCMSDTSRVGGIVSTNASVYSSQPPTWNPVEMSLEYKIASPHLNENGQANLGTYTLAISNDVIKCLYGLSQLPASATISIVYGDSVTSVGTVAVGSRNGWSYFNASGFHYSNPTIKVKFAQPVEAITPTPTPTPTATPSPTRAPVTSIWCAKGSKKVKVEGVKPTCPKGYKKTTAPKGR